jgi:predicted dehydrogenase
MTPQRFIHIGTGGWGRYWSRTVIPHLLERGIAEPVAAVDVNPANLVNAREGYGIAAERCYTDPVKAFAEQEADFAIVVVPPAHHEAIVDLALGAGCHILSEKPVADTMASSARIFLKVTRAGRKMAITMSHRFDRDKQTLERLVRSGAYGPVNYIVGRLALNNRRFGDWGDFRHRIADPLLIEAAVHQFGIIRGLAGATAKSVYATSWNPDWGEYAGDSTALAVVEMENGIRASYEGSKTNASTISPWEEEYWRVECRDGTLELDRRRLRVLRGTAKEMPTAEELALDEGPVWLNPLLAEQFVGWLDGGPPVATRIEDSIHDTALTMAAIESAHTGRAIDVPAYTQAALDAAAEELGVPA